jgi:hypothetical protein
MAGNRLDHRPIPERIYEPNIIHNPFSWMGIWTPQGWRVHRKRWGTARRLVRRLSGDGKRTFFPEVLRDPQTGRVEWSDDLHLKEDSFTDGGIYPADPRVEYPAGQLRWQVSHTLMVGPVADHNLYTHEYTWDMTHGHLQTHFRRHVALEQARTDATDGMTVAVANRPISTTIEGNVQYPLPNSAVRGVWANPEKTGRNYYTRRLTQLFAMHNAVYGIAPHTPVVQCHGMWATDPADPLKELFDADSGECLDEPRLIEQLRIPLDSPKIGMLQFAYRTGQSRVYEGPVTLLATNDGAVDEAHLRDLRQRIGERYVHGRVGYAFASIGGRSANLFDGYHTKFDLNDDGVIDERDEQLLSVHLGRTVRYNLYSDAYFGGDWLTTSVCLTPEHSRGTPIIANYEHGGGYDAQAGVVRLLRTPGPNRPVWVEYHYDAPAEAGENNIVVHFYHEEGA